MVPLADQSEPRLADWMRNYGAGLRRYFRRRADPNDIDDLLQEVFRRLRPSETRVDPQSFTFTVARNVLMDYHRRRVADRATAHHLIDDDIGALTDLLSPERIVIGRQEYQRAVEAILALPPRARAAFQFHRFEDMTYDAIAQRMGITRNSVKELIGRALVSLSRAMGDEL